MSGIYLSVALLVGCVMGQSGRVFGVEPSFDVPVINVTVNEGDIAVLPCSVEHLGENKVVWTDQWSTLLTLVDRRIIDDTRISIERPQTRDWNLHIRHSVYKDRGQYTCQINTNPVKTKIVMLIVQVPSKIIDELSSRDQTVREGETVTLICNVTGVPTPEVKWFKLPMAGLSTEKDRLDLEPGVLTTMGECSYTLQQTGIGTSGEVLIIHNVSRYCDGTYACVAFNGVEPAVTRKIQVFVEFAPEVSLPSKRMGQFMGMDTILDCEISAYPHGVTMWKRNNREIDVLNNKNKYSVDLYSGNEESTRKTLSLRVIGVQREDFGEYACYAENSIGEDEETMILFDYSEHLQKETTTSPRPMIIAPDGGAVIYPDKQESSSSGGNRWNDHGVYNTGPSRGHYDPDRTRGGPSNNRPYPQGDGSVALSAKAGASKNICCVTSLVYVISLITSLTQS